MMTLKGFLTTALLLALMLVALGLALLFPDFWPWLMGKKPDNQDY